MRCPDPARVTRETRNGARACPRRGGSGRARGAACVRAPGVVRQGIDRLRRDDPGKEGRTKSDRLDQAIARCRGRHRQQRHACRARRTRVIIPRLAVGRGGCVGSSRSIVVVTGVVPVARVLTGNVGAARGQSVRWSVVRRQGVRRRAQPAGQERRDHSQREHGRRMTAGQIAEYEQRGRQGAFRCAAGWSSVEPAGTGSRANDNEFSFTIPRCRRFCQPIPKTRAGTTTAPRRGGRASRKVNGMFGYCSYSVSGLALVSASGTTPAWIAIRASSTRLVTPSLVPSETRCHSMVFTLR